MKQDRFAQQLRKKLDSHQVAAPDELWAGIEAALQQQQPLPAAAGSGRGRARFMWLRRWAVAASVLLLLGGGALWWMLRSDDSHHVDSEKMLAEMVTTAQPEQQQTQREEPAAATAETPHSRPDVGMPKAGTHTVSKNNETPTLATTATTPADSEPQTTPATTVHKETAEATEPTAGHTTQAEAAIALEPQPASTSSKRSKAVSISLFAANSLASQHNSNGVLMADNMAQRFAEAYDNSYTPGARTTRPIYLSGYEEHQHHQQPLSFGLSVALPLSQRLSLNTGIVYTRLRSDFTQLMRGQQLQQRQVLHYVGVPLNACFSWLSHSGFSTYLAAGIEADWNVSARMQTEGVNQHLGRDRMQWSVGGSLGLQYNLTPHISIYAEPGLRHYFDNGSNVVNYFKDKPTALSLQAGLRLQWQ